MLRLWIAPALLLFALPQEIDGAKAAKGLLDRVAAKINAAKTVGYSFKVISDERGRRQKKGELVSGEVLVRPPGEVRIVLSDEHGQTQIRGDGKIVITEGRSDILRRVTDDSKALADHARRAALYGFVALQDEEKADLDFDDADNFFIGGREKVEGVETQAIAYDVKIRRQEKMRITIRAWIDPEKLMIVKREYFFQGMGQIKEVVSNIVYDEALPADEFALQSPRLLRGAVEGQVARSVELYARFMGRLPERLEDLDAPSKALEAGSFWPEGGFWIGGKRPADLEYSVSGGTAKLGAQSLTVQFGGRVSSSTDRLRQFYSARVRLLLVHAAAEAWHRAYSRLPEKIEDLTTKPVGIEFWPEGGFVGAAQVKDPWGEAMILSGEKGRVVVACAGGRERVIRIRQLTAEESRALRAGMFPAPSPETRKQAEAALDRLRVDDIEIRQNAVKDLLAMSLPALPIVEERLGKPAGGEDMAMLKVVRDRLQAMPQTWRTELRPLKAEFRPGEKSEVSIESNERNAISALKSVTAAQADFRANDRDNNRTNDFWVRDLAGLYGLAPSPDGKEDAAPGKDDGTNIMKLIEAEFAAADATKGRRNYPQAPAEDPEAFEGYYFVAMKFEVIGGTKTVLDEGKGRNADCFAFLAYPSEYGVTGKRSFIVNEDNTIWCQDLGDREVDVDTFPAAPPAFGWSKVD